MRKLHGVPVAAAALAAVGLVTVAAPALAAGRREAQRELDDLARGQGTLAGQAAAAAADGYYDLAQRAFDALDFDNALKLVNRALEANPNHQKANELAMKVRAIKGVQTDRVRAALLAMSEAKRVQIQQSLIAIAEAIKDGKIAKGDAERQEPGEEDSSKDDLKLSRRIAKVDEAVNHFKRVLEVIKWMPYQIDLSERESEVRGLLDNCIRQRGEWEEALRASKRRRAFEKAEAALTEENEFLRDRLAKLLEMAKVQYNRLRFEECEKICGTILEIDPLDKEVRTLLGDARQRRHEQEDERIYQQEKHHVRGAMLNVEAAAIPYSDRLVYPSDWDRILRRVETAGRIETEVEPEWAKAIKRTLERKVSFEFVQTPLSEAIAFLQTLTNVNMILDPRAVEGNDMRIDLRVTNMSLNLALDWILRLAELNYALRDSAVFISTRDNLRGDVLLRIYDVRDLTDDLPDYPGPEFQLEVGGVESLGGGGLALMDTGMGGEEVTAGSIAELISSRVNPTEWAAELGTSIEERGGRLVVMQRPEVHRLIDKLLQSFRASEKILVTVEGRFLEIREGFLEEIGIDWGAPPLLGGDPELGNTITSSTFSVVGSRPAGIIPEPRDVDIGGDGTLHMLAAINNYRPNFSPQGTDLATADATMLNQGLNMQFRHIGNMEVQAFLHALKAREAGTTLSSPRLTVANTQRAHMFVAQQQAYIADYEISGSSYDPVIRRFLQGVVFDVKPIVSADRRYVTLEMRPSTAKLAPGSPWTATITTWQGEPLEHTLSFQVQFPELVLRKVRTTATIPDGGILLIGGQMSDVKFRAESGVPFLSNIPVLGRLFRWDNTDNERKNLSILVTAQILLFEEEERQQ